MGSSRDKQRFDKEQRRGWREYIDSEVVDLRPHKKEEKKEETREDSVSKPQKENSAPSTQPELSTRKFFVEPKDEYINEYVEELKRYKNRKKQSTQDKDTEDIQKAFYNDESQENELLSQERLLEELREVERRDMELNKKIPELSVSGQDVKEAMQPEDGASSESSVDLIPSGKRKDKGDDSEEDEEPEEEDLQETSREDKDTSNKSSGEDFKEIKDSKERKKILKSPHPRENEFGTHTFGRQEVDKTKKERKKKIRAKPKKREEKSSRKAVYITIIAALILGAGAMLSVKAFAVKDKARVRAGSAYAFMQAGKEELLQLNSKEATEYFDKALNEFSAVEDDLGFLGENVINYASLVPMSEQVNSSAHLLRAGESFAQAGKEASLALGVLQGIDLDKNNNTYPTDKLAKAKTHLKRVQAKIKDANTDLVRVDPEQLPEKFREDIIAFQSQTNRFEGVFERAFSSIDTLLTFLGHNKNKEYLLVFQNSSELRATGGFIGTYGLVELKKGQLENFLVDGIYNPDGQLPVKIVPPKPLQYITPTWGVRDANWFFDFPASASKILWIYRNVSPDSVPSGVIAVTPSFVEDLLTITGPISMPEYDKEVSADNLLDTVRTNIEKNKTSDNPKRILSDLTPKLIERLKEVDDKKQLIQRLFSNLNQKNLQIYSRDDSVQDMIQKYNWGGRIKEANNGSKTLDDYLSVVFSNIGGGKSDRFTNTEVDTVSEVKENGEIYRTVLISRKHNGNSSSKPWYNKANYGYLRLYTPKGSELVSAQGFAEEPEYLDANYESGEYIHDPLVTKIQKSKKEDEDSGTEIFTETGKTVFGNWLLVEPGERTVAEVTYKLPGSVEGAEEYNLVIQKQSGVNASYSGALSASDSNVRFTECFRGNTPLEESEFRFQQLQDAVISCSIRD